MTIKINHEKITVCDKCFRASCWQGVFQCDEYRNAGTVEKSKAELKKLGLEWHGYWEKHNSAWLFGHKKPTHDGEN